MTLSHKWMFNIQAFGYPANHQGDESLYDIIIISIVKAGKTEYLIKQ